MNKLDGPIPLKILFVDISGRNGNSLKSNLRKLSKKNRITAKQFEPQGHHVASGAGFDNLFDRIITSLTTESFDLVCFVRNVGRIRQPFLRSVLRLNKLNSSGIYFFDEIDSTSIIRKIPIHRAKYSPIRFSFQDYLGSLLLISSDLITNHKSSSPVSIQEFLFQSEISLPGTIRHEQVFAFEKYQEEISATSVSEKAKPNLQLQPLVSIVIPTRGKTLQGESEPIALTAVKSIVSKSNYQNFEIIIVADDGHDPDLDQRLIEIAGKRIQVVEWKKPFNFSEKINLGYTYCSGEYLVLMNDDVTVISPDWIEQMLIFGLRPNIGLVGALLYFPNETIQHAGQAVFKGAPSHIGMGQPRGSKGPENAYLVPREVTGVTAACALISKVDFMRAGGFSALLPGNFNDVDFCFKIRSLGLEIVITPFAELYHHESITRDSHVHYYELDFIRSRWSGLLDDDKFWPEHPFKSARKVWAIDRFFGLGLYRNTQL